MRRGSDAMRHLSLRPLSSKRCAGAVCAGSSHTFEVCKWTGYEYVRLAGSLRPQSAGWSGRSPSPCVRQAPPVVAIAPPPGRTYKALLLRLPCDKHQ